MTPAAAYLCLALSLGADPRPLDLIGNFSGVQREDIMTALYPKWDPVTKRLGEQRVLKARGKTVTADNADIWEAAVWREPSIKETIPEHLVVLVSTFSYLPGEPGDSLEDRDPRRGSDAHGLLFCDVGVLDRTEGKLQVRALLKDAFLCGGSAFPALDVNTRVVGTQPAFGVRLQLSHGEETDVTLYLYAPDKKGLKQVRKITEEITLNRGWKRLEGGVTKGQTVRIKGSTAKVPRFDAADNRADPNAPLGALMCRIAGSDEVKVAPWPADAEDEAEASLHFTADRNGPIECRVNDEKPKESTFLEVKVEDPAPPKPKPAAEEQ
jgi:hypothetical protein